MKQIKIYFINFLKKNKNLRMITRKILYFKNLFFYKICAIGTSIDNHSIIFSSYSGKNYSCSPKAIYEFMINNDQYKNYNFIWCFKEPSKYTFLKNNPNTQVIKYNSIQFFRYISKTKYWVFNYNMFNYIYPKKNQIYIQCWHGTPLKKLGNDLINKYNAMNSIDEIHKKYDCEAKKFTYFISPSNFATECFISAWNLKKMHMTEKIIEKGYPRNDFLYNYKKSDVSKIKKELKLPKNKKIILYAPTWRDDQHQSGIGYIHKNIIDFDKLQKELSSKYIVLFRAHYLIANKIDFNKYKNFVYDVSDIDDINFLYIVSDILITDYSSVFFDFANLKRPILFYMYDYDKYKNSLRDFYINLNELPGPIIKKEQELINEIRNIDNYEKKYRNKYEKFNKKYNYLDDGYASERVVRECIK